MRTVSGRSVTDTTCVLQSLQRFVVTDLSNFYLDICKDRLYVRGADSFDRRASQTVLAALLQARGTCLFAFRCCLEQSG